MRQEHPDADSITPAEALALLDGARTDGRLAFKLALLDMMAAGLLTLPPDGPATSTSSSAAISRTGARPTVTTANPYVLSTDAAAWARSKRHCTAAVRALSLGGAAGSPYPFRSAALGLRDAHGADASGFVADCLLPDLADAGLLAAERPEPRRGLFGWRALLGDPPIRYGATTQGVSVRRAWAERLDAAKLLAQDLHDAPDAVARREDREGVALLAGAAGPALLLLDAFTPADLRLIRRSGAELGHRTTLLLDHAARHGRRLDRGLARLKDGTDDLTSTGHYGGAGVI